MRNKYMPHTITETDVANTTDLELAFATTRLLPKMEDIPIEFIKGNIYTETVEAIFCGIELPDASMEFNLDVSPGDVNKCITAHLRSFEPKHEHKIAGIGYILSKIATLRKKSGED
jgi:hypothetical protein